MQLPVRMQQAALLIPLGLPVYAKNVKGLNSMHV